MSHLHSRAATALENVAATRDVVQALRTVGKVRHYGDRVCFPSERAFQASLPASIDDVGANVMSTQDRCETIAQQAELALVRPLIVVRRSLHITGSGRITGTCAARRW
jgi:hypothetical protein